MRPARYFSIIQLSNARVEKYKIERVPLTIIDEDEKISGVKTIDEMAELVKMHVKKK